MPRPNSYAVFCLKKKRSNGPNRNVTSTEEHLTTKGEINSFAEHERLTWSRPLWLGACFRGQALAPKGATLRALGLDRKSTAKQGDHHAMNADTGPLGKQESEALAKNLLTGEASYKCPSSRPWRATSFCGTFC